MDLGSRFQCVKGNNARSITFKICTVDDRDNIPIIATGEMNGAFQIVYNWIGAKKRGVIGLTAYSAGYFPPTGTVINDGKWHSVVVTYDGATLRIYVDGQPDNESKVWNVESTELIAKTVNTGPSNTTFVGRSLWGEPTCKRLKGKLSDIRFYHLKVSNITISV